MATAFTAIRRPWAIAALREGVPSHTWPAEGDFVARGDLEAAVPVPPDDLEATPALLQQFDDSQGSAIVVARGGRIEYAHFADGYSPSTAFNSFSMVKSLVGFLTLQAISDGLIADLDATVGELWSDAADSPLAAVTVGDLLDMRSGIVFEHPVGDVGGADTNKEQARTYSPFSNFSRLHIDGPDSVLDHVDVVPAERDRFVYQNLNTAILGRLLEHVTGVSLDELVDREIATPAGAGGFRWRHHPSSDQVSAYCCLYATTGWWVAVADHLMHNGHDQPLLTDEWFDYFIGRDLGPADLVDGEYRSQIRYDVFDRDGEDLGGPFLFFTGRGGQTTYLVPGDDLIVVRFGQLNQPLHSTVYEAARPGAS